MKRFGLVVAGAAILALAACGDSGGGGSTAAAHPSCKDNDSTAAYVEKALSDISEATVKGKITAEQAQKAGEKLNAEISAGVGENAKERPVGYMCTVVDDLKKELGL